MTAQPINGYLNNRVLKINVGFLLADGPGNIRDFDLDVPTVRVSDDLILSYARGKVRLSRTKEGILVQARLEAGIPAECYRCLEPVEQTLDIDLEELYAYHSEVKTEFMIGENAELDLSPLLRAEALMAADHRAMCRPDCNGLCPECGTNLNDSTCDCELGNIDPRLAALKSLLK
jgi:uncharacterized protein